MLHLTVLSWHSQNSFTDFLLNRWLVRDVLRMFVHLLAKMGCEWCKFMLGIGKLGQFYMTDSLCAPSCMKLATQVIRNVWWTKAWTHENLHISSLLISRSGSPNALLSLRALLFPTWKRTALLTRTLVKRVRPLFEAHRHVGEDEVMLARFVWLNHDSQATKWHRSAPFPVCSAQWVQEPRLRCSRLTIWLTKCHRFESSDNKNIDFIFLFKKKIYNLFLISKQQDVNLQKKKKFEQQQWHSSNHRMISSWTLTLSVLWGRTMLFITTTSSSTVTASPRIVIPSFEL